MPKVCKNCFIDSELVAFITSQSLLGDCNFCSSKNIECVESDELNAFFTELLSHFKHDPNGLGINKKIQSNLSLFSSFNTATALLNDILAKIKTPFASANELVEFSDVILDNVNYWDSLKKKLVEESRYLTDINYLTYDLGWDGFFATQIEVPKGMELFRARLHSNSGEPPFKLTDMSCPPKNLIKSGRANPTGIPCLYLSDNYLTTLYEVRAGLLDEVSIGKFVVKKSITHPVLISDFTESGSIFHPSRVEQKIKSTLLKKKDKCRPI